ncbi:MAG: TRAP-type transport system small permease component [Saliniramus fredricksonii]|uniref:TRAP transporter small permease protein n=1 Tax=Saliniramus fredricksonii TaxID=1653334 RepID=A0A0P7YC19_9HYPH|nr:TRAP transporter small permease subunit [Saliniramus fredricksonii]KPQ11619.1 MAG: TRAP-type transport system small permease component [Saliniramus fredricksonii]SCC80352.1 TRAP-type mannitol/chloroaromatic compound transport system, small permease component [Saliniramus fredricksonii]
MRLLLCLSRGIDRVNALIGRAASWLVLAAILVAAGLALSRRLFSVSSNAWYESQWLFFAAIVMLGAAWTLRLDRHVRIDILISRAPPVYRRRLDIIGHTVMLIPFCVLHVWLAIPWFYRAFESGETSPNLGGLPLWPIRLVIVIGLSLLLAQAFSELIKRIAGRA